MRPFRFCPSCGNSLSEPDNDSGAHCSRCDKTWYQNAAPTAGCVVVRGGRALITRRARDPEKDRFDIPGGFLQPDEDPVTAVRREVKEELGIEVEVSISDCMQMVPHRYGSDGDFVLAIGFLARHASGEPTPADDVAEVRWVGPDEIDDVDFAWDHDRDLVRKALTENE